MTRIPVILVGILSLSLVQAAPSDPLETITLHHRSADEVLPLIEPLLKPDDSATGAGSLLILRTDARTLSDIQKALKALDQPLRNLLISVRDQATGHTERQGITGSARIETDSGAVVIGKHAKPGIRLDIQAEDQANQGGADYRLRVLEGQSALIQMGQSVPVRTLPYGALGYQDVTQGVYVVPRVQGDTVTLAINPQRETLEGSRIRTQAMTTTVTGRLGEWIALGSINQAEQRAETGLLTRRSGTSAQRYGVMVKVEVLD